MGVMEYRYNETARRCGIDVPDFKLINGKYFATKRFDIEDGKRLHIATAGALLSESIAQPKLEYKTLLHLTGYLTQDAKQVDEMFRRMVFNVLTDNKDDHAKNGEHATSANNNGKPTVEDMITVGESIRISRKKGMDMIHSIAEGCSDILVKGLSFDYIRRGDFLFEYITKGIATIHQCRKMISQIPHSPTSRTEKKILQHL